MKSVKGIIHIHSNCSYDGKHSLEEIAQHGIKRGYSFIGMTEHSDTLNEERMVEYVKECQNVSSQDCLIFPGIEFTCENDLHLIGLGVRHYTEKKGPLEVAKFIRQQDGIAIIAHPFRNNYRLHSNLFSIVDGIEVWNTAYDGRFVPNIHSLILLRNLRKNGYSILGFGGQDLHQIRDHMSVEVSLSIENLTEKSLFLALKGGHYRISNSHLSVSPGGDTNLLRLVQIGLARKIYELALQIRNKFKKEED